MENSEKRELAMSTIIKLQDMIIRRLKRPATKNSIKDLEEKVLMLKERLSLKKRRNDLNIKYDNEL